MANNGNLNQNTETRVPIMETFTLPSNGVLYGSEIPKEITLRAMTTMDEKIRLSSNGMSSIINLLNSCVVSPENFDAGNLKMFDVQYLLYMLRIVTYGSLYNVDVYCSHCDKAVRVGVNLDDLAVNQVPDDFVEPFEIGPLPKSGDIITCKILTMNENINMEKESKKILAKYKDYVGDPSFVLSYKYIIDKVNGESIPDYKKQVYVEDMNAMDLRYLDSIYDEMVNNFGLDTVIDTECPTCGIDLHFSMPITEEFFRPKFSI